MIDPIGMTVREWSDAVRLTVKSAWSLGRLDDEALWRDWAVGLVRANSITAQVLPDPYGFDDWREWAMRAYPMLEVT